MADTDVRIPEYQECPFCDRIFEERGLISPVGTPTPLEAHIVRVHKKVRVRKGSNYKWLDQAEVKKRLSL
jgi:hypothetical protein